MRVCLHLAVFLDVYAVFPVHVPQTVGRDQIDVNCALFVLLQFSHLYVACPWREDPLGIGASLCARIARTHYMRVWARVYCTHRKQMDQPAPPSSPRVSCSPSVTVPLTLGDASCSATATCAHAAASAVPPATNHQSSPTNAMVISTTHADNLYQYHWGQLTQLIDVAKPTELELSLEIITNSYANPTTLDPMLLGAKLLTIAVERAMQDVKDALAAALAASSVDVATASLVPAASTPVGTTPPPVDFSVIIPLLERIAERQDKKLRQAASRLAKKVAQSERSASRPIGAPDNPSSKTSSVRHFCGHGVCISSLPGNTA